MKKELRIVKRFLNNLLVIILCFLLPLFLCILGIHFSPAEAKLSDETLEIVEDLRWKHYPFASGFTQPDIEWWAQQYPYIKFEDGILYIVDENVTWFVEMEKVIEQ